MAGLTEQGLIIKRLQEVIADNSLRAGVIFSDVVPPGDSVDTGPNTALGRMIGVVAPAEADLWEAVQAVHDAYDPLKASGVALDNQVILSGINRFPSSPTRSEVILEGSTGTVILINSKVSSPTTNQIYSLESTVVLNTDDVVGIGIRIVTVANSDEYTITYQFAGEVSPTVISVTSGVSTNEDLIFDQFIAEIAANHPDLETEKRNEYLFIYKTDPLESMDIAASSNIGIEKIQKLGIVFNDAVGPVEQPTGTISAIATPILGWDSVRNPVDATPGRYLETDDELRLRFRNSKFLRGTNIFDSLYSDLVNIENIEEFYIYNNDEDTTDPITGIPPHSYMVVVQGGLATQIGQAIWNNKPPGIPNVGNTAVTVRDIQSIARTVYFERPTPVPIYITLDIEPYETLASDTQQRIKDAIRDYFEENYGIGSEIRYTRLYTPINSIAGFEINSLYIGIAPTPDATDNIQLGFNEIWSLDDNDIEITITPA